MDISEDIRSTRSILGRFKRRDFSGTTGQAMKNSSYQLAQNLIFKFGSLAFTILIARLLLPEKMGLYSLALSTIVLFAAFSNLGTGEALMTYCSRMLGQNKGAKAKGYVKILLRWKLFLVVITGLILLSSSYFVANYYYGKPIFFALLAGIIYIPVMGFVGFIEAMFKANENFRIPLMKEIIFQISRLIIIPILIILFLKSGFSDKIIVFIAIMGLALSYFVGLIFMTANAKRKIGFLKKHAQKLTKSEIVDLKKFTYPLSATALAGMFFGYVDTIMLGHYVESEFIAYYGAAFGLVGGASAIIGFMAAAMMPIFARKSGKALEDIFRKTRNLTALVALCGGIFTYIVAWWVIRLAYGVEYLPSVSVLRIFSLLIFLLPVLAVYRGYFVTQGKTKELAWLIFGSAVLNILFNFVGIVLGLKVGGEMGAVYGACGATILSRVVYLGGLVFCRKRK